MQFLQADEKLQEQFAADIPELVHATGPVSYDYHFPKRAIFDALVPHDRHPRLYPLQMQQCLYLHGPDARNGLVNYFLSSLVREIR